MLTVDTRNQLSRLIAEENRNELQCREYLKHAHYFLIGAELIHDTTSKEEFPTQTGPSDYLICGTVDSGIGTTEHRIVVWELKAPQCPMFENDSQSSRLKPSKDLVDAENKLFNHYHQLMSNSAIRTQFRITNDSQIRLGGIIISRDDKLVPGIKDNSTIEQNFRLARVVREQYVFKPNNMRLLSWDYIVNCLQPEQISGRQEVRRERLDLVASDDTNITLQSSGDNLP